MTRSSIAEEVALVEPGGSGVELGCWPGIDDPVGITGSLDENLEWCMSGVLDAGLECELGGVEVLVG